MLSIAVQNSFRIKGKVNTRGKKCIFSFLYRVCSKMEGSNRMALSWM